MARFGDLTSATEIKEYLLDVVDRSLSSDIVPFIMIFPDMY